MSAARMAGDTALAAPSSIFSTEREHIPTVTTPVCADVCDGLKPMRYTMVDFVFVILLFVGE